MLILLVFPLASQAVTPFISVAFQPTITFSSNDWGSYQLNGNDLGKYHFTYAGAATVGIRAGRREFYIEHNWKNSPTKDEYNRSVWNQVDSLVTRRSTSYYSRFKDHRGKLGARWAIAENSRRTVTSLIGCGLSLGTTTHGSYQSTYTSTYTIDSTGYAVPNSHVGSFEHFVSSQISRYSIGLFIQMGSQFAIYQNLSAMIFGELHTYCTQFVTESFWYESVDWYRQIEPSLSIALRYDLK